MLLPFNVALAYPSGSILTESQFQGASKPETILSFLDVRHKVWDLSLIMHKPPVDLETWNSLLAIVAALRAPDGCPWDLEQTHRSLAPFAIEEAFELAEAIETTGESASQAAIIGELGDLLLQVALHAQVAADRGSFGIKDVLRAINEKMVRRHPHVFEVPGTEAATAKTSSDVLAQWQTIKAKEKGSEKTTFKFDVPRALPSLQRAAKIGEKTKSFRFDWPNWQGVLNKVDEELLELKAVLDSEPSYNSKPKEQAETGASQDPVANELGDLLFSIAQLARHRGLDPEQCLRETNARFERRFAILRELETEQSKNDGRDWNSRASDEIEEMWATAKKQEAKERT